MALMDDAGLKALTKKTSQKLFQQLKGGSGIRDVESDSTRARARALAVLHRRALQPGGHLTEAAGALRGRQRSPRSIAPTRCARTSTRRSTSAPPARKWREVIFQMVTYGGMPVVVDALEVYGQVLAERGEPFPGKSRRGERRGAGGRRRRRPGGRARRVEVLHHGGFEIVLQPDATPVTQADREAERTIVEILGRTFPEHGFLGEEFGSSGKRHDALDHRSHRRHEELRAPHPDLGDLDRARGARRDHGRRHPQSGDRRVSTPRAGRRRAS